MYTDRVRSAARRRVPAIVLAAGTGSRFGAEPKLLADLEGRPVLQHVLDAVAAVPELGPVVVVLGERTAQVRESVAWRDESIVLNPAPGRGLASSLRVGLDAIPADSAGALVLLGDQPRVRPEVIRALLADPPRRDELASVPDYADGGGPNPALLSRDAFAAARSLEGDAGMLAVFAADPSRLRRVAVSGTNPDVDTPADLAAMAVARG